MGAVLTGPDPRFAEDDGSAPEDLAEALAAYEQHLRGLGGAEDPSRTSAASEPDPRGALADPTTRVLATLQTARVMVPVVAVAGREQERAASGEDSSDGSGSAGAEMATVLMRGRDGRVALLAFTGTDAMRRWDPQARPVPVTCPEAARAAVAEEAVALVLDVAGPVRFVVETEDLRAMAEGYTLAELGGRRAWVRHDVRSVDPS